MRLHYLVKLKICDFFVKILMLESETPEILLILILLIKRHATF